MSQQNNYGSEAKPYIYTDSYCEDNWSSIEAIVEKPDKTIISIPNDRITKGTTNCSWHWEQNELDQNGRYRVQCIFSVGTTQLYHGVIETFIVKENL